MTTHQLSIDRFKVESTLGSGGMATVYLASDPKLERQVAIKVLTHVGIPAELRSENETINLREEQAFSRVGSELLREARVMAKLTHPNVLPVYEVGVNEGRLFLVTEYIAGLDGRHWLNNPEHSVDDILALFTQAGAGLIAAHGAGIVHRDFKPENILVGDDHRVRVADFGISALLSSESQSESQSMVRRTATTGTPEYMAPELKAGNSATSASDVYSFALTVAEAICGGRPERADRQDLDRLIASLRANGLSAHAAQLIGRALDDDPKKRPSLDELLNSFSPQKRRMLPILAGVGVVLSASLVAIIAFSRPSAEASCRQTWPELESAWSPAHRMQLEQLAAASGHSYAPKRQVQIGRELDHYVDKLTDLRVYGCQARERGELSREKYEGRIECLERAAFELGDLTHRMVAKTAMKTAAATFDQFGARVEGLPDLGNCLSSKARAPRDPIARERSRALHQRWLDVRAESAKTAVALKKQIAVLDEIADEADEIRDIDLEARAQLGVGWRQRELGDLEAAEMAYQRVFDISNREGLEDKATLAMEALARVATRRGDRKGAQQLARIATGMIKRFEARPQLQAKLLATVGDVEKISGNYEKAIKILKKAREVIELDQDPSHLTISRIETTLCSALRYARRLEESLVHCQRSVEHLMLVFGSTEHVRVAEIEGNIGLALQELGRYPEALEIQYRTQKIVEKAYGADHHVSVNGRSNIATTYFSMRKYDNALAAYLQVLEFAESGKLGSFRTRALGNIGNLYRSTLDFETARGYLSRAVESGRAIGGADHPDVARYLQDLSQVEIRLHHLDAAAAALSEASDILIERYGDKHIKVATLLWRQSDLALDRGKFSEAIRLGEQALEVYRGVKGKEANKGKEIKMAKVYLTLSQARNARREWTQALAAAEPALVVYVSQKMVISVAFTRFNKARAEWGLRRNRGSAIQVARASLKVLASEPNAKPWGDIVSAWLRRPNAR